MTHRTMWSEKPPAPPEIEDEDDHWGEEPEAQDCLLLQVFLGAVVGIALAVVARAVGLL